MSWAAKYVGIPYGDQGRDRAGCDCWGLARLVYAAELRIDLPSYAGAYASAAEMEEVAGLIAAEQATFIRGEDPVGVFDLLLFRQGRHNSHIGIALDTRRMLHVARGDQAKIEDYTAPRWSSRLIGNFRHAAIPGEGAA